MTIELLINLLIKRVARLSVVIIVVISFMSLYTPRAFAQPRNAVRIIKDLSYVDATGRLHILAEVINDSDNPITDINIKASLYDKDGYFVMPPKNYYKKYLTSVISLSKPALPFQMPVSCPRHPKSL